MITVRIPTSARILAPALALTLLGVACDPDTTAPEIPYAPGEPTSTLPPLDGAPAPGEALTPAVRHAPLPDVRVWGSLRGINADGDTSPNVTLRDALDALDGPGELVALGNVAGLRGEITAVGNTLAISRPCDDGLCQETLSPDDIPDALAATLLVATRVEGWIDLFAPEDLDLDALATFLANTRQERGLGNDPMPVVILGAIDHFHGHVVDADRLGARIAGTCEDRAARLPAITGDDLEGRLVLFHDPGPPGRIVSHVRPLHVHALLADGRSLHVDAATVRAGNRIRIPRTEY
ncbi:MAG: hypothetical protein EA398_05035 [Deltaproteobacteria bacterium]|nr:MAG: hypothetical protein EA398_05035 [Deltaproteobacteria bacterium]